MNDGFKKSWKTSVVKQRKQWSEGEGRYQAGVDFFSRVPLDSKGLNKCQSQFDQWGGYSRQEEIGNKQILSMGYWNLEGSMVASIEVPLFWRLSNRVSCLSSPNCDGLI